VAVLGFTTVEESLQLERPNRKCLRTGSCGRRAICGRDWYRGRRNRPCSVWRREGHVGAYILIARLKHLAFLNRTKGIADA
jgi:hypothetical protein